MRNIFAEVVFSKVDTDNNFCRNPFSKVDTMIRSLVMSLFARDICNIRRKFVAILAESDNFQFVDDCQLG